MPYARGHAGAEASPCPIPWALQSLPGTLGAGGSPRARRGPKYGQAALGTGFAAKHPLVLRPPGQVVRNKLGQRGCEQEAMAIEAVDVDGAAANSDLGDVVGECGAHP